MAYLVGSFCRMALGSPDIEIHKCLNGFVRHLVKKEEISFVTDHFMLFLKAGEAARNACPQLQEKIIKRS